jgi:hypothetical protein
VAEPTTADWPPEDGAETVACSITLPRGIKGETPEAAINIRQRDAGVQIDALDRPVVDHERNASKVPAHEALPVWVPAGARGSGEVILLSVVDRADQIEPVVQRIFRAAPEYVVDPVDIVGVGGDPDRRKILVPDNVSGHVIAADRLEAVRIVITRVGVGKYS